MKLTKILTCSADSVTTLVYCTYLDFGKERTDTESWKRSIVGWKNFRWDILVWHDGSFDRLLL